MIKPAKVRKSVERPVPRILVVDDDSELCKSVSQYLTRKGFQVEAIYDGVQGIERALSGAYSLIILDITLPGIRGFEVLRQIRAKSRLPVIMVPARGEVVDRIVGLEMGADDCLPKPFNLRELAARIRAVLGRGTQISTAVSRHIILGDVELEERARIARCGNHALELTSLEFDILAVFLHRPSQVVTCKELVRSLPGHELVPLDRSIDVHISNLRKKMGPYPDGANRFRNIRGVGYIYVIPGRSKD